MYHNQTNILQLKFNLNRKLSQMATSISLDNTTSKCSKPYIASLNGIDKFSHIYKIVKFRSNIGYLGHNYQEVSCDF